MPKIKTIETIVVTKEEIQKHLDEANTEFRENYAAFSAEIQSLDTMEIAIEFEWGDWKHEHGYADYVMREHGFIKTDEQVTEEDGSDCYSSIHYYTYGGES